MITSPLKDYDETRARQVKKILKTIGLSVTRKEALQLDSLLPHGVEAKLNQIAHYTKSSRIKRKTILSYWY